MKNGCNAETLNEFGTDTLSARGVTDVAGTLMVNVAHSLKIIDSLSLI